ncbi:MAG: hypothetical protein AB7O66_23230 [Limisphaerales bacterium]
MNSSWKGWAWSVPMVVAAMFLAGCGNSESTKAAGKESSSENARPQGAGNPLTAPVDYIGAVGAAQRQAAKTVDLTSLNQAVQAFQAGEERLPKSLQELVTEGYLPRIPAAPKGTQWSYHPPTGQIRVVQLPPTPGATRP